MYCFSFLLSKWLKNAAFNRNTVYQVLFVTEYIHNPQKIRVSLILLHEVFTHFHVLCFAIHWCPPGITESSPALPAQYLNLLTILARIYPALNWNNTCHSYQSIWCSMLKFRLKTENTAVSAAASTYEMRKMIHQVRTLILTFTTPATNCRWLPRQF